MKPQVAALADAPTERIGRIPWPSGADRCDSVRRRGRLWHGTHSGQCDAPSPGRSGRSRPEQGYRNGSARSAESASGQQIPAAMVCTAVIGNE